MTQEKREQFDRIAPLIGRTPLLEIHYRFRGEARRLFAKMESYNLTGNIKDRVAFHILRKAYERGTIQPGDRIIEATSGNTGIAFSALGRYLGHDVIIYMPDWMSMERIRLMESYGAEVRLVSREEGGFLGSIAMTEELARGGGVFLPRQFSNEDNTETHFLYTGAEIAEQLETLGLRADGVVAGVGTGGTVMGIGRRLRQVNPACKVFPLEPANSPTLSTGYKVGSPPDSGHFRRVHPFHCEAGGVGRGDIGGGRGRAADGADAVRAAGPGGRGVLRGQFRGRRHGAERPGRGHGGGHHLRGRQ